MTTKIYTVKDTGSLITDTNTVAAIVANERNETIAETWYGGFRTRWYNAKGWTGCNRFTVDRISDSAVAVTLIGQLYP